jgi:putative colanic acid biosynthesis acetyltransferase WcaF
VIRLARQVYYLILAIVNLMLKLAPHPIISLLILKILRQNVAWNASIHRGLYIYSLKPHSLTIGQRTIINPSVKLDGRGGLIIGNDVAISTGCALYSYNHDHHHINRPTIAKKTIVGSGAFIYSYAIILPGSVINRFTVIGAGSVISGKTKPNALYAGNPGRLITDDYQIDGKNGFYNYAFVP